MRIDSAPHWENDVVRLAVLTPEDVSDAYVAWLNDAEINRYLESRFAVHDRAGVAAYVESMLANPSSLFLAIHSKALGQHVGNIKIGPIDHHHGLGEIGLMIGDVVNGIMKNGEAGDGQVEARVKEQVAALCKRFPIYA